MSGRLQLRPLLLAGLMAAGVAVSTGACASDAPAAVNRDSGPEAVQVTVHGDGFVVTSARRIPLEGLVHELRQRVRPLSAADRQRFSVGIDVDAEGGDAARDAARRLVDELRIMGIGHVRYL